MSRFISPVVLAVYIFLSTSSFASAQMPTEVVARQHPPDPAFSKVTSAQLSRMLGKNMFGKEMLDFLIDKRHRPLASFAGEPSKKGLAAVEFLWPSDGINVFCDSTSTIQQISLTLSNWKGEIPFGLKGDMQSADVIGKLGAPTRSISPIPGIAGTVLYYDNHGLKVFFSPTPEAKELADKKDQEQLKALKHVESLSAVMIFKTK